MTHNTLNYWILGVSVAVGIAVTVVSSKGKRSVIWNCIGVMIALGGFILVENRNDEALVNDQIETIQGELENRFNVSGVAVERTKKQSGSVGNYFVIDAENGQYTAQFNPDKSAGFELQEKYGESLRSRRNAYEAVYAIPEEQRPAEIYLEYQNADLYTLKGDLGDWKIVMKEDVVNQILDDEGVVRYTQHIRPNIYEGEMKDE